jgi:hypothetical protein
MHKLKIFFSSYPIRELLNVYVFARNFANFRNFHLFRSCIAFLNLNDPLPKVIQVRTWKRMVKYLFTSPCMGKLKNSFPFKGQ